MREPLKDRIRLEHTLAAINNVFQYTDGKTIQQLNDDTMLFYATVKNVEIIGEAAYHLTRAFCKEHPRPHGTMSCGCVIISFTTTTKSDSTKFGRL